MNISIIVATFGSEEWRRRGVRASDQARADHDAHEVVTVHLPEGTLAEARNLAAWQADGDWLCFLDADDELAPRYLWAMRASHAANGAPARALLTPAVQYVRGRRRMPPKIWPAMDLRLGNFMVIGTLVPRALFLEVEGFREWPLYEDWCLWQRCWIAGAEIVEVPAAVYVAHTRLRSRNRAPFRSEKLRVHAEIVAANFPEFVA